MQELAKQKYCKQSPYNTFILQKAEGAEFWFLGMPCSCSLLFRAGGKRVKNDMLNKPWHFWGVNGYSKCLKYSAVYRSAFSILLVSSVCPCPLLLSYKAPTSMFPVLPSGLPVPQPSSCILHLWDPSLQSTAEDFKAGCLYTSPPNLA